MSAALPTGTVTFLFTDVEGSTGLLERLGAEEYGRELGRHREIVREALAEHGGVEVDTQGDAFFCAFGSARAAAACAAEIQGQLAATQIRVRMGVHTGEALVVDRHYVGMDVHRAARIAACGHGGQVVLSPATVALLESDVELRELGPHRLKDLAAPVVLHQLGPEEFPPLKTLYRTNLPVPATLFLGRERELSELISVSSEPGVRLLTLTGPGGTGKTRLALQVAAELADAYPDGVWWVPLAPTRDETAVGSVVASALDVDEEPGREVVDSLASALAGKRLLLLLDNCEHLVDAVAGLVARLGTACPELSVLATSREALAVSGEHVFSVPPLDEDDAIELFDARARAVGATLRGGETQSVVRELCSRLDRLPLAVELAAARAAALPPAALLERLSSTLDLLKGPRDADDRQRTLRATIVWSYDLLDADERRVFRSFSVFVGGASLSAIEAVCDASLDDVLSLASKSLVRRTSAESDEPRYFMLETIREFAADELEASDELAASCDRHLEWYARGLPAAGSVELDELGGEELDRLELELENLRAAFAWSARRSDSDSVSVSVRLADVLWQRHFMRGRYAEAEAVARRALALDADPLDAAFFHDRLGITLRLLGRPRDALASYLAGERALEGVVDRDDAWWERWIRLKLDQAHFFYFENDQEAHGVALDELEPAVEAHGTGGQRLDLLHARMQYRYRLERYALSAETEELARQVYELDRANGLVTRDFTLGFCLLWRGKLEDAEAHLDRGLESARRAGLALFEVRCLVYGLLIMRRRNDVGRARARLAELESFDELHGYDGLIRACAAWVAYREGDYEAAVRHGEFALDEWGSEGRLGYGVFQWTARFPLLGVAVAQGDLGAADAHAREMLGELQNPLPDDIAASLAAGGDDSYAHTLELARQGGYA